MRGQKENKKDVFKRYSTALIVSARKNALFEGTSCNVPLCSKTTREGGSSRRPTTATVEYIIYEITLCSPVRRWLISQNMRRVVASSLLGFEPNFSYNLIIPGRRSIICTFFTSARALTEICTFTAN